MRFCCCLVLAIMFAPAFLSMQAEDKAAHGASEANKFMNIPGLPTCTRGSVQNGDPTKSSFVILAKVAAGCTIPWHWHSITEQVMMVSGSGKVSMKDGAPAMLHAGSYVNLPSKGVHEFHCVAACTLFIASDGAFDIHYVDKEGKEISIDEALKSEAKAPMKKKAKT